MPNPLRDSTFQIHDAWVERLWLVARLRELNTEIRDFLQTNTYVIQVALSRT